MTTHTAPLPARRPRRTFRADPLLAAFLVALLLGLGTKWALGGFAPAPSRAATVPHVALVVDGGSHPAAALSRAAAIASAAERSGRADVSVRVPRTAAEAAADIRYFAAQRDMSRVVVVGPVSTAAARGAASDYPGTRVTARPAVADVLE